MTHDIIFHAVSKRKWPEYNKGGTFNPTNLPNEKVIITCASSNNLKEYLNENFKGRKNLFLLVIDRFRVHHKIENDGHNSNVYIHGAINIDAILDKIRIDCDKNGLFDIEIESND